MNAELKLAAGKRRVLLRDAVSVVLLNTVVALTLVLFALALAPQVSAGQREHLLLVHLAFSQAIGLLIFAPIELFRLTLWWQRRPGLPALGIVTALAIPFGYLLGSAAARVLLAMPAVSQPLFGPAAPAVALVTVVASLIAVFVVTQRDRLEAERLRAENADVRATSARLQLLQQQIEPHMLFNTLANVHALIDDEPGRAQELLEALSELLHASMQTGERPLVSLQQEFALLEQYLRLMAIRMGPRLRYDMVLPSELAQVQLPPLSLQPLVENAVKHGLDPTVDGGNIRVAAHRDGKCVRVVVVDDGSGLGGNDPFAPGRIGLSNVRQRLVMAFGARAGLQVEDNPPRGVLATLTLPA